MHSPRLLIFTLALAFSGLSRAAGTVYYNGLIRTSAQPGSVVKWLLVKDGKVEAVGKKLPLPAGATLVDLRGRVLLPSLTDAHAHIADIGEELSEVDLTAAKTPEEAASMTKDFATKHPTEGALVGNNWDQSSWPGQAFPNRATLDALFPDRSVILYRVDGHSAWLNTFALHAFHIWEKKSDPEGGKIVRDAKGEPTGVLIDTAMKELSVLSGQTSDEETDEHIKVAVEEALSMGITSIHDAAATPRQVEAIRRLLKGGRLSFRFYEMVHTDDPQELPKILARGIEKDSENGRLTVRAVKLFADGAMGSRGAAFEEPYSDDPGNRGLLQMSEEELERNMRAIDAKGFQIAVHAIGTLGNQVTIDAFEKALGSKIREKRPRLEHAQVLTLAQIRRIAKLGIIASMQPIHCTSDMKWIEKRIGRKRARYSYAWASVLNAGIPLAFGSDAPVDDLNPWHGMFAAIRRQTADFKPSTGFNPQERISLPEAYRAYTEGAAFARFSEKELGSLQKGKWADFIIVAKDPFKASPRKLRDMQVEETYVGGEKAWPITPRT